MRSKYHICVQLKIQIFLLTLKVIGTSERILGRKEEY